MYIWVGCLWNTWARPRTNIISIAGSVPTKHLIHSHDWIEDYKVIVCEHSNKEKQHVERPHHVEKYYTVFEKYIAVRISDAPSASWALRWARPRLGRRWLAWAPATRRWAAARGWWGSRSDTRILVTAGNLCKDGSFTITGKVPIRALWTCVVEHGVLILS